MHIEFYTVCKIWALFCNYQKAYSALKVLWIFLGTPYRQLVSGICFISTNGSIMTFQWCAKTFHGCSTEGSITSYCKSMDSIGSATNLWEFPMCFYASCVEKWTHTHPKAKTSDCLEKGSWSSAVSGESWQMISGARWQSHPLGIRSLSSLLLQRQRNTQQTKIHLSPANWIHFIFRHAFMFLRLAQIICLNTSGEENTISSRKRKLQSGVKVWNTNWVLFFTCCSVFLSKWNSW